jgi:hypothetical protein
MLNRSTLNHAPGESCDRNASFHGVDGAPYDHRFRCANCGQTGVIEARLSKSSAEDIF